MANCLVLGGNGLIGSFITEQLVAKGNNVRVFDNFKNKDNLKTINSKIEKIKGNYLNRNDTKNALKGIDYVFHSIHTTVPRTSTKKPVFDAKTNILPSINILKDSCNFGIQKIIYISSLSVYGNPKITPIKENTPLNPLTPYGVSKKSIEGYIEFFNRIYGIDYTIIRPSTTYSEKQIVSPETGVVANFVFNALTNKPLIIYGNGNAERNLLHAKDLAKGVITAGFSKSKYKVFNLGANETVSINQLVKKVKKIKKGFIKIKYINKTDEIQKLVCDISRAKSELNWKPEISLDKGIKKCFTEFKKKH